MKIEYLQLMKANAEFIKEQFNNIANTYNLKWINEGEYGVNIENDKVSIVIESERWESGYIMFLEDKKNKKSYYIDEILTSKGIAIENDNYLTEEEKTTLQGLPQNKESDDYNIYLFRVVLEKYGTDILNQ